MQQMTMLLIDIVFAQAACRMVLTRSSFASKSYGSARSCELYGVDQFLRLQVCHCCMHCLDAAVAALLKGKGQSYQFQLLWKRFPSPCTHNWTPRPL